MNDHRPKETVSHSAASAGHKGGWGPIRMPDDQYNRWWLERVMRRVKTDANGCWLWQGWKNWKGYGETTYRNKCAFVHRTVYALKVGPVPPGMQVCHKCDVRHCCNPDHLWLGTNADNHRDKDVKGRNYFSNQTHCKRGHEFTPENTYLTRGYGTRGPARSCKTCTRLRMSSPKYKAQAKERQRRKRALRHSEVA